MPHLMTLGAPAYAQTIAVGWTFVLRQTIIPASLPSWYDLSNRPQSLNSALFWIVGLCANKTISLSGFQKRPLIVYRIFCIGCVRHIFALYVLSITTGWVGVCCYCARLIKRAKSSTSVYPIRANRSTLGAETTLTAENSCPASLGSGLCTTSQSLTLSRRPTGRRRCRIHQYYLDDICSAQSPAVTKTP